MTYLPEYKMRIILQFIVWKIGVLTQKISFRVINIWAKIRKRPNWEMRSEDDCVINSFNVVPVLHFLCYLVNMLTMCFEIKILKSVGMSKMPYYIPLSSCTHVCKCAVSVIWYILFFKMFKEQRSSVVVCKSAGSVLSVYNVTWMSCDLCVVVWYVWIL